jgi:hypothetical protein
MAKINARGDRVAIQLRKPNGGLVTLTERGRLLEQPSKGAGYTLINAHWVQSGEAITSRAEVLARLLERRYPAAEVLS